MQMVSHVPSRPQVACVKRSLARAGIVVDDGRAMMGIGGRGKGPARGAYVGDREGQSCLFHDPNTLLFKCPEALKSSLEATMRLLKGFHLRFS